MKLQTILGLTALFLFQAVFVWGASFPDEWYFPSSREGAGLRVLEGREAPELKTSAWEGSATSLNDSRGKVVVLDFWATWCGPCIASIPKNIELVKDGSDRDLVFIGVHSASGGWDKAPAMILDKGINYPVALDAGGETAKAYKVRSIPTYVVIDRAGVIRAAGLLPNHIKDVVKLLVAESGPGTVSPSPSSEFDDAWFYGGADRPSSWQGQDGKPAKPIRVNEWAGAQPEASEGAVQVLQFTRPELSLARQHLEILAKLAQTYAVQGVQFSAICDAKADWKQMKSKAGDWAPGVPVALDRPVLMSLLSEEHYAETGALTADLSEGGQDLAFPEVGQPAGPQRTMIITSSGRTVIRTEPGMQKNTGAQQQPPPNRPSGGLPQPDNKVAAREAGMTARAYGIRMAPVTVVIDRSGKIRATGLKLEHLKEVLDKLLAESIQAPPSET